MKNRFEVLNAVRMPEDCPPCKYEDIEDNLKVMFTEALSQTEYNLKNSQLDTCTAASNQSVTITQEFSKLDEKFFAHAMEVRSEFLKSDEKFSTILSRISNLEENLSTLKNDLREILETIKGGS